MSLSKVVKISPRVRRVHLQRYLVSKIVYEEDKFNLIDLCCLFENQLWLEEKSFKDNDFQQKFGKTLEALADTLMKINFRQSFTQRALSRFRLRVKNLKDFLIPARNYKDAKRTYSGTFSLADSKQLGKDKKLIPPKARIGKGYSDKGSAKNVAKDGSPHWSEVATHFEPEPLEEEYDETVEACSANIAAAILETVRGDSKLRERKSSGSTCKSTKKVTRISKAKSFK